jgi:hypothetical protein
VESTLTECSNPISLLMTRIDTRTGQVTEHPYQKDCGTRLADRCPYCSEIFRRDAFSVIRSGLKDKSGQQVSLSFLTLTAPGAEVFGAIHQRIVKPRKKGKPVVRKCGCGLRHYEGDKVLGTPIDPSTYRYDLVADFNAHATRLLAVTMQKLRRITGSDLSRVRVAEYQVRGLIHFHILVRADISQEDFEMAVRGGYNAKTKRNIKPSAHAGWKWGPQCNIQHIVPGGKIGVGAYLVKLVGYAVKSTSSSVNGAWDHEAKMRKAAIKNCKCPGGLQCSEGPVMKKGAAIPYKGTKAKKFCRRHQLAYNGWGFRGHVLSVSRSWGDSFTEVRERRRTFASASPKTPSDHYLITWTVVPTYTPRR